MLRLSELSQTQKSKTERKRYGELLLNGYKLCLCDEEVLETDRGDNRTTLQKYSMPLHYIYIAEMTNFMLSYFTIIKT